MIKEQQQSQKENHEINKPPHMVRFLTAVLLSTNFMLVTSFISVINNILQEESLFGLMFLRNIVNHGRQLDGRHLCSNGALPQ